jgi:hypothetical protein
MKLRLPDDLEAVDGREFVDPLGSDESTAFRPTSPPNDGVDASFLKVDIKIAILV